MHQLWLVCFHLHNASLQDSKDQSERSPLARKKEKLKGRGEDTQKKYLYAIQYNGQTNMHNEPVQQWRQMTPGENITVEFCSKRTGTFWHVPLPTVNDTISYNIYEDGCPTNNPVCSLHGATNRHSECGTKNNAGRVSWHFFWSSTFLSRAFTLMFWTPLDPINAVAKTPPPQPQKHHHYKNSTTPITPPQQHHHHHHDNTTATPRVYSYITFGLLLSGQSVVYCFELHWILSTRSKILETSSRFEIHAHAQHMRVFWMKWNQWYH